MAAGNLCIIHDWRTAARLAWVRITAARGKGVLESSTILPAPEQPKERSSACNAGTRRRSARKAAAGLPLQLRSDHLEVRRREAWERGGARQLQHGRELDRCQAPRL